MYKIPEVPSSIPSTTTKKKRKKKELNGIRKMPGSRIGVLAGP
jgi:hypothetical protein